MEELCNIATYEQYKQSLDTELQQATESFVRIGYLLKVARDTDILKESGYSNVVEFAQAEYNIDKTQVSRFININNRFSENGYSDRLIEQYRGIGYAKLSIMLQLPDEINEEITPDFSKAEIQTIKEEVEEEKKISDIEVLMEDKTDIEQIEGELTQVFWQLGQQNPDIYAGMWAAVMETVYDGSIEPAVMKLIEVLAPAGEAIHSVRIPGTGRIMVSVKEAESVIRLINARTGEKAEYGYDAVISAIEEICDIPDAKTSYEKQYGIKFPEEKKAEVAPVQQKKEPKRPENKPEQKKADIKKSRVTKAEPQKEPVANRKTEFVVEHVDNLFESQEENPEKAINPPCENDFREKESKEQDEAGSSTEQDEAGSSTEQDEGGSSAEERKKRIQELQAQSGEYMQMRSCARNSMSNLNTSMEANAWKAAKADAEHLVHYLTVMIGMEEVHHV